MNGKCVLLKQCVPWHSVLPRLCACVMKTRFSVDKLEIWVSHAKRIKRITHTQSCFLFLSAVLIHERRFDAYEHATASGNRRQSGARKRGGIRGQ